MIKAAFFAPMKPPNHPVPSGDRAMARALLEALAAAEIDAQLASTVQLRDGQGSAARQAELTKIAQAEVARLLSVERRKGWRLWITYHSYYKAPDLIGPAVARGLDIPYIQIEATRARKRLTGQWAAFAQAAENATDSAAAVFYLTRQDEEALRAYGPPTQRLVHLRPFIAQSDLPPMTAGTAGMLCVGMFRAGDKLASYKLIADTLSLLQSADWRLDIVGDGPERPAVEALMAPFGDKVHFCGALDPADVGDAYGKARLLFWPGVNEAFGMTYLEAQAAGVPVVAQDRPGVRDVLAPASAYPLPEAGAKGLAARIDLLLSTPKLTHHLGAQARKYVARNHLLDAARDTLRHAIDEVLS